MFTPTHAQVDKPKLIVSSPTDDGLGGHDHPEEEEEEEEEHDDHGSGAEMSTFKFAVLTAGIISMTFLVAYLVDDLQIGKSLYPRWASQSATPPPAIYVSPRSG